MGRLIPTSLAAHYVLTGIHSPLRFGVIETQDGFIRSIQSKVPFVEKSSIVFKNGIIIPPAPLRRTDPSLPTQLTDAWGSSTETRSDLLTLWEQYCAHKRDYRTVLFRLQEIYPQAQLTSLLRFWLGLFTSNDEQQNGDKGPYLYPGSPARFISIQHFNFDQFRLSDQSRLEEIDWTLTNQSTYKNEQPA